jgi:hypothetical protein
MQNGFKANVFLIKPEKVSSYDESMAAEFTTLRISSATNDALMHLKNRLEKKRGRSVSAVALAEQLLAQAVAACVSEHPSPMREVRYIRDELGFSADADAINTVLDKLSRIEAAMTGDNDTPKAAEQPAGEIVKMPAHGAPGVRYPAKPRAKGK